MSAVASRVASDQIVVLERAALDRWGSDDPGGFLELLIVTSRKPD